MTKDEALNLAQKELIFYRDFANCQDWRDESQVVITAIKEILSQPEQEPAVKLQEPTVERAWFTIAELNAWADKKLSENPHWVMPKEEPERDEPPPQRTWVGLTDEEILDVNLSKVKKLIDDPIVCDTDHNIIQLGKAIEAKLKEKNNG